MADMTLLDALNASLTRTKTYIDTELAKKANSSHGTHLTLGTTSSTAYRGDYGNIAYTHSQAAHAPSNAQKNSDITKAEIEAKLTGAITSHTHNAIASRGNVTCESGVAGRPAVSGLSMTQAYNNGYPINYGNIINLKGQGDGQILVGWSGTDGAHAPVYVRSKRDNTSTADWSNWAQIYTTANPQTTITGNASTATKLATARTISLTGDATGSASFDGSANASIAVNRRRCVVGQTSSTSTNPYYKFASVQLTEDYEDKEIVFKVSTGYSNNKASGILRAHVRSTGTALSNTELYWEYADEGIDVSKFILAYNKPTAYPITVELWVKIDSSYIHYHFDVLQEHERGNTITRWTLYNTCAAGSASAITSGYTQVASTCLNIKNPITGNAATATKLATARTLTIGNTGKTFNGSGNVSWSHAEMGVARGNTASATTAATAQWYRIAETANNIDNNMATFNIEGNVSSYHTSTLLAAGISFGRNPTLGQLAHTNYGGGITKARIVYTESYSSNKAYLEVYLSQAKATIITVDMQGQNGWTLVTPSTVGSIPSGYTSKEITLAVGKIVGDFKGTGEFSSLAMSGSITLNNNNVIRSKTPADYTNTNSSTTVAAGTVVNLLQYNGSGNLHLGPGPYDAYLNTGNTYINSANNALYRTRNTGYHQFQINDTAIVNIKSNGIDAAQQIYAKAGVKSGANIVSDTAITDNLGTAAIPWKAAYAGQFQIYSEASNQYGYVKADTIGTTSTIGVTRMALGNNIAYGTASNARGVIRLYGNNTGYTEVYPGYNSTGSCTITLPSSSGTLALHNHTHNYAGSSSAGGTASSVNGLTLWTGTQAQYDAISSKSSTTLYFIKEG